MHAQLLDKYPAFAANRAQAAAGRPVRQFQHLTSEKQLGTGYEQLENAYAALFQQMISSPAEAQVLFHEVVVQELDCYILNGTLAGHAFEVATFGPDNLIMDYDSPIELFKLERYRAGNELFTANQFYDSYEQLKLAAEMDNLPNSKYQLALARLCSHLQLAYKFGILAALVVFFYLLPLEVPLLSLITRNHTDHSHGFVFVQAVLALGTAYVSNRYLAFRQSFLVKEDIKRFFTGFGWTLAGLLVIESVLLGGYWMVELVSR